MSKQGAHYTVPYVNAVEPVSIQEHDHYYLVNGVEISKTDLEEKYPEPHNDFWFAARNKNLQRLLSFLSDVYNIWKHDRLTGELNLKLFGIAGNLVSKLNVTSYSYNEAFKTSLKQIKPAA